ncbi:hypothetical protein LTR37_003773 [Vermiconidia calcicola]|uniref:Uncharacterized protein n=1 Tax=Vermiconidia calcicola TaxID=1690605 RepID=A0ACC3NNU7_9PEZI|nr:hypothetical protein LTR37_003773 [Vermiconidia calcicola]
MPRYKRTRDEAELDIPLEPDVPAQHAGTLTKLRNMWEFASFMQYIFLFGHVVKVDDDFDIEDLEAECLRPEPSPRLSQIALALLKYVSSHRGLTPDIFDEYTRRQYLVKASERNPFGDEEEPASFKDFDVFTKVRVLQQLSTWTFGNAERIRGLMPQDEDHLTWRMEPLGWDKEDRAYFVLDDNRLYRRTDEPPPPPSPKPKAKSKATPKKNKGRGTRASKRRRVEEVEEDEAEEADVEAGAQEDTVMTDGDNAVSQNEGYGFTDKTWECIAITLDEYQDFLASIFRSRDPNEKQLRKRIEEDVLPIIEKRAEALRQKQMKKMRELENLEKMATAKRSTRLAGKAEKEKEERELREAEEKKQAELRMAHEEQERQKRIEEGHESRRLTREQRLKEREVKRILHEEELAKLEEEATRASSQDPTSEAASDGAKRLSERQLKTQRARHKEELEKMAEEEDKWYFDCVKCGMHGENLDDGTHSIACERCGVWQHSKCHGFSPKQAENEGFHFICTTCKRKEVDAKKPKIAPLKLSKNRQSASPDTQRTTSRPSTANASNGAKGALPDHVVRQLDGQYYPPPHQQPPGPPRHITNGPSLSPYGQAQGPPGYRYPPVGNFAPQQHHPPQQPWQGSPFPTPQRPPSSGYAGSPPPPRSDGYGPPRQHQQQHQSMHQNAIAGNPGHPLNHASHHQPPHQPPQMNGHSPRASGSGYAMTEPPRQHQQHQQMNHYYNPQGQPPHQPHQRTGSQGQLMNGFQSPVKNAARPASSSSLQQGQRQPTYGQAHQYHPAHSPQQPQQQPPSNLAPSPNANFPPPHQAYPHQAAQSPTKPSPPHYQQQPVYQQQAPWMASASSPQQDFRPPSSNGIAPNHHTPRHPQALQQIPHVTNAVQHPSPAGSNANAVAADGMSGPWPQGSKAIPQKHDRSPAPAPPPLQATPTSYVSQSSPVGPPSNATPNMAPPLALSPSQQMQEQAHAAGPGSVPVKKMVAGAVQGGSGLGTE